MPSELLTWIKATEEKMGRDLTEKHKSRVIDMDILLAEECIIQTEELQIPHPKLAERNFVLAPLTEIAPDAFHPILHKRIRVLFQESKDSHRVEIVSKSG
jgi:2-amino-4-hydroxy-6-hydroxymethyldihydropteridine diphosphokinase